MPASRLQAAALWLACAIAIDAVATPVRAYRTLSDAPDTTSATLVTWQTDGPVFVVADPDGLGDPVQLEPAVRATLDVLGAVDCARLAATYGGAGEAHAVSGDGVNTIEIVRTGWVARGFDSGRGATSDVLLRAISLDSLAIVEADLYLNFDEFEWSFETAAEGQLDVRGVLTHELLHCIGVAHPCGDPGAPDCSSSPTFMESAVYPDYVGPSQRTLSSDDVAAVCALYPVRPSCDCAAGQICVDGTCRAPACETGMCPCADDLDCTAGLACAVGGERVGECIAEASFGAPCASGNDCESRICVTGAFPSFCTGTCFEDRMCPADLVCRAIDGLSVCAPPLRRSSSCSTSGTGSQASAAMLVVAALALVTRRRSR